MKKNIIEELKKMNFDTGVEFLSQNGYYENGSGAPDGADERALCVGDHFLTDVYYTSEDEDGNEHTISFVQEWEKSQDEDILIKEYWEEL